MDLRRLYLFAIAVAGAIPPNLLNNCMRDTAGGEYSPPPYYLGIPVPLVMSCFVGFFTARKFSGVFSNNPTMFRSMIRGCVLALFSYTGASIFLSIWFGLFCSGAMGFLNFVLAPIAPLLFVVLLVQQSEFLWIPVLCIGAAALLGILFTQRQENAT